MVVDYLNKCKLEEPVADLDISEIARIVKTDILGTEIEDVKFLTAHSSVTQANPSVEFDATLKPHEFEDIEQDLKKGLPPIAWVTNGKAPHQWKHAVVVTQLDRTNGTIHYNDPAIGARKEERLEEFSQKWYESDRWIVRVILGRKEVRKLTEYMKRGDAK